MGKIKDMLTGLFSKKDEDDADEIIQIESVDEPDRDFMENENRYETPDYQSFLSEMGYVEKDGEVKSTEIPDMPQNDFAAACDAEPIAEEAAQAAEHLVQAEYEAEPSDVEASQAANETEELTAEADWIAPETEQATDAEQTAPETEQAAEVEFDQEFIDEGVAELGVNDVWSEEEN